MRYIDIKDCVVRVDRTLELVPTALLEEFMPELSGMNLSTLFEVELPGMRCIVHALKEEMFNYYMVCTVVMGDVPAFFFTVEGGEEWDQHTCHILSKDATMTLIKTIVTMYIDEAYKRIQLTPVTGVEEVSELLATLDGEEIMYGTRACWRTTQSCD